NLYCVPSIWVYPFRVSRSEEPGCLVIEPCCCSQSRLFPAVVKTNRQIRVLLTNVLSERQIARHSKLLKQMMLMGQLPTTRMMPTGFHPTHQRFTAKLRSGQGGPS